MTKVIAASLGKTKATTILYQLKNVTERYLLFRNNFSSFARLLQREEPSHVLLLGLYPRGKKIKIETECFNEQKQILSIPYFFAENELFTLAKTIGNGRCNYHTAQVLTLLQPHFPATKLTFLHLPTSINTQTASKAIDLQLAGL